MFLAEEVPLKRSHKYMKVSIYKISVMCGYRFEHVRMSLEIYVYIWNMIDVDIYTYAYSTVLSIYI